MDLERRLARTLLLDHAADAAAVLDALSTQEAADILAAHPEGLTTGVVERMSPERSAALFEHLPVERGAGLLRGLAIDLAASLLRRLGATRRDALLAALPAERRDELARLLRFPPGSAGALMDPRVTVLMEDMTIAEALRSVRRSTDSTLTNLYVVDREHRLVGVLNLQELVATRSRERLAPLVREPAWRLSAMADRLAVAGHPGWRHVSSLPVVDANGVFLGAIRYRTFRELEIELRDAAGHEGVAPTARALGQLFAAGLGGLADAIAQSLAPPAANRANDGADG